MRSFRLLTPVVRHEDVFVERYDALLRQARHLTSSPAEAEDLVQDAFVRFSLACPDLSKVGSIDAYLYAMLRNLHLSRVRRASLVETAPLSLLEFDSAERGLRALDARDRLQIRDELRIACLYGCARRTSSKAGSFFLLRFFHGAVPSEIAAIARTPARLVDRWLAIARHEVQLFSREPDRLPFPKAAALKPSRRDLTLDTPDLNPADALSECRGYMFAQRHKHCLTRREIDALYAGDRDAAVPTATLAEIVTCPRCLRQVCERLGIDRWTDRFPTDTLGRNARPNAGQPPARDRQPARKAADALPEVREHRPRQLRVAINGFVLTTHQVTTDVTDFALTVSLHEPVAIVEVFSEQGICIGHLDVEPPPAGPVEAYARIALSDDRVAELTLAFHGPWPVLRIVYRDPALPAAGAIARDPIFEPADADDVADQPQLAATVAVADAATSDATPSPQPWWRRWLTDARAAMSPRRRAFVMATAVIVIALLFFGPPAGLAAASERFVHAVVELVRTVFQLQPPAPSSRHTPPVTPPRDRPLVDPRPLSNTAKLPTSAPSHAPGPPRVRLRAIDDVEMEAWHRLHALRLPFGPNALVSGLGDGGGVRVRVRLEGEFRRNVVERALASLALNRAVRLDIETVGSDASASPGSATAAMTAADVERSPAYAPLRAAFVAQMSGAPSETIDRVTRATAEWIVEQAAGMRPTADGLRCFLDRWPATRLASLDLDAQTKWETIVRDYALDLGEQAEHLQLRLPPAFAADAPETVNPPPSAFETAGDVEQAAARLLALVAAQHTLIQRSFSNQDVPAAFDPAALRQAFVSTEGEARRFAGPLPVGR